MTFKQHATAMAPPRARHVTQSLAHLALLAAALAATANHAGAQQAKKGGPEFTKQGLLIVNFIPGPGADLKLGRRAADVVRSRMGKLVNKRDVDVIDGGDIRDKLDRADFDPDATLDISTMRSVGRALRADEFLVAHVTSGPGVVRLSGHLILARDEKLQQPIAEVVAPKLDSAALLFARSLASARAQLVPERRCENALREGSGERAIASAREGRATYPHATIASTCLVWALRQSHSPHAEVLAVSREILSVDSLNVHAIEGAAISLDSLRQRPEAADMWLRLAATDTANMDLALKVSYALLDGGNAKRAEPYIVAVADAHPDELGLLQQKWRVSYENKSWKNAVAAGEQLLLRDSVARSDSTFFLRLGTAYHASSLPYRAIETVAHGVSSFPRDSRLYALYTQYIKAEADTVIPRGLALFPRNADLAAMNARDLRARGKLSESLDATRLAVSLDSTLSQGRLTVAQIQIELGRPDSALVALHEALLAGEDSTLVSQFALAKGNVLYRAANGTKTSADFGLALRFLTYADSVRSTQQSKFLVGAAAFGIAQASLTEATKLKDKAESCRLARLGGSMIPVARAGLEAGQEMFAEAAKQSLDYLGQLEPYAVQTLAAFCGGH